MRLLSFLGISQLNSPSRKGFAMKLFGVWQHASFWLRILVDG